VHVGIEYTKKAQEVIFDIIYEYDVLTDSFHEHDMKKEYKYT